jgi:hypothetical protein
MLSQQERPSEMSKQLMTLLTDEDGTSFVEFSLFVGFLFLTGAGFLYFAGSQFKDAFMSPKQMSF